MNENEFNEKMQFYRQRRARNISLAVMGYFIGIVCIIGCTVLFGAPVVGVLMFMLVIAASTGLIIYTNMSTPLEFSGKYAETYGYDGFAENYNGGSYAGAAGDSANGFDEGYSTREVSTETNGTDGSAGAGNNGAAGANGGGPFGGAGGAGGNTRRADPRYYMNRRVSPSARMFKQVMEIFWLAVTILYFIISFSTMKWYITWIIWLIGAALDRAIRILWETRLFDDFENKR